MNATPADRRETNLRLPLYAVLTVIGLAFALAIDSRLDARRGGAPADSATTTAAIVAERALRFEDLQGGDIGIFDDASGERIDTLAPGQDNFMRGMVRALVRERRKAGIGRELPFHLSLHGDGHLLLADPATGERLDLGSFGSENISDFARLLPAGAAVNAAGGHSLHAPAG